MVMNSEVLAQHKKEKAEYDRIYNQQHKVEKKEWSKQYYRNNKLEILQKTNEYNRNHRLETAKREVKWTLALKTRVITHYGNGKAACVKCGFSDIRALVIDHINGDGASHRKTVKGIGMRFYLWLEKNNYPDGFQTLCSNCNLIKMIDNKENGRNK